MSYAVTEQNDDLNKTEVYLQDHQSLESIKDEPLSVVSEDDVDGKRRSKCKGMSLISLFIK